MGKKMEGKLAAEGKKFALVISRFNEFVSERLLGGARDGLERHGAAAADIDEAWVPGSFEMPLVASRLAGTGNYDAVICLAVVKASSCVGSFAAAPRPMPSAGGEVNKKERLPLSSGRSWISGSG